MSVATSTAIGLAVAAGTAGASIYGAHKSSQSADNAAQLTTTAANHSADLQDAATQRAEAFQRQQAEQQWMASQQTQKANYDQWRARQGTIAGFAAQYGVNASPIPDYQPGIDPHYNTPGASPANSATGTTATTSDPTAPFNNAAPPSSVAGLTAPIPSPTTAAPASAAASTGTQTPSVFLKGLLDSGMDPEQAASQTNAQFNLQTGSQAKYYAPSSQTSGKAVIGLPDSYISKEPSGWAVTQRSTGGVVARSNAPMGSIAGATGDTSGMSLPQINTPMPTPFPMGSIGYARTR